MSIDIETVAVIDDDVCSPAEAVLIGTSLLTLLAALVGLILSF